MPSSHLILCRPLLLLPPIPPSVRVFSSESTLCMKWPKCWIFSFSISPSNEYSGLISFRMDWLDLLAVQGTLKSLFQHHSSKASILQCKRQLLSWVWGEGARALGAGGLRGKCVLTHPRAGRGFENQRSDTRFEQDWQLTWGEWLQTKAGREEPVALFGFVFSRVQDPRKRRQVARCHQARGFARWLSGGAETMGTVGVGWWGWPVCGSNA